jgi:hypothetical protein
VKLHFIVNEKEVHSLDSTIVPDVRDTVSFRTPASSPLTGVVISRHVKFLPDSTENVAITLGPIEDK